MEWPITFACNNNCINCILDTRQTKYKGEPFLKQIQEVLQKVPGGETISLTGGEPTIRKEFFEILRIARKENPKNFIFIVSNGRMFSNKKFTEKLASMDLEPLRLGIPIYSHKKAVHDRITRASGSWTETTKGLKNLLAKGFDVELRILVQKSNFRELDETARFIAKEFSEIERVTFINLKYTGNAFINRKNVFVKYSEAVPFVQNAVDVLLDHKFEVKLFHFPLCILKKKYWPLAEGITKQEVELFLPKKCESCSEKNRCPRIWKSYIPLAGTDEFKPIKRKQKHLKT